MRALSIRQPYAELILRGSKRIEYRSRPTRIIGERFYIYAAGKRWSGSAPRSPVWSGELSGAAAPPPWMIELANALKLFPHELPTGVIVGSAVIEKVTRGEEYYEWHLRSVERAARLVKPSGKPQPVWFQPF